MEKLIFAITAWIGIPIATAGTFDDRAANLQMVLHTMNLKSSASSLGRVTNLLGEICNYYAEGSHITPEQFTRHSDEFNKTKLEMQIKLDLASELLANLHEDPNNQVQVRQSLEFAETIQKSLDSWVQLQELIEINLDLLSERIQEDGPGSAIPEPQVIPEAIRVRNDLRALQELQQEARALMERPVASSSELLGLFSRTVRFTHDLLVRQSWVATTLARGSQAMSQDRHRIPQILAGLENIGNMQAVIGPYLIQYQELIEELATSGGRPPVPGSLEEVDNLLHTIQEGLRQSIRDRSRSSASGT